MPSASQSCWFAENVSKGVATLSILIGEGSYRLAVASNVGFVPVAVRGDPTHRRFQMA